MKALQILNGKYFLTSISFVVGIILGQFLGNWGRPLHPATGDGMDVRAPIAQANGASSAELPDSPGVLRNSEQIQDSTSVEYLSRLLRHSSPEDRLMGILQLIELENVEVLQRAIAAYESAVKNGLSRSLEGHVLYKALGQLIGARALDGFEALSEQEKTSLSTRSILEGWATSDPKGALQWLGESGCADNVSRNLSESLFEGACQSSVEDGDLVFNQLPASNRQHLAASVVKNRLNIEGV